MRRLRPFEVFCYGVGHFLNDMTAGLWFSFLMIFLTEVAHLDASHAGTVMLSGQVADALATPLVGWASDHTNFRWGRRKIWVFLGAVLVNLSFFFVFNECWVCERTGLDPTLWFSALASLFNVGWAALQVAHMALVPDLTSDEHERTKLNSARYAGCIAATLAVLLITTVCFNQLGLSYGAFRITSLCAMGLGDVMTVLFLFGTPEPTRRKDGRFTINSSGSGVHGSSGSFRDELRSSLKIVQHEWFAWFKKLPFYQVTLVYMLARISVNLSQVYMPFYLRRSLRLFAHADVLSEVPAVIMVVSFVVTLAMRNFNAGIGRLACFAYGAVLVAFGSGTLFFIQPLWWWSIFVFAVILGLGQTALLVTAVSMEADLVDKQVSTGAFVYGFMSFADKIGNGILIKFMSPFTEEDKDVRYLNALLPSTSAILGLLLVMSMPTYWAQLRSKMTGKPEEQVVTAAPMPSEYVPPPEVVGSIHSSMNGQHFHRALSEAQESYYGDIHDPLLAQVDEEYTRVMTDASDFGTHADPSQAVAEESHN